jgi:DnaJ family protein B protein 12
MLTTRSPKVEYYVKPDFQLPRPGSELDKFESSVIDEYVSDLRQNCQREKQYKESLLWRARMMNDQNLYRQAQQQTTPSCTKLNDLIRGYT